ncbi:hypothetical protein CASFOL_040089 [Castilleja foliolosa]|uniref:B3 domain-containing transcription repressor VAL2 n=1 Tax=Castilleja foliolosa TaxID=1961234 RepID=A0ABD3BEI9_9LAMI
MDEMVVCMNGKCASSSNSGEWKKGWPLRSTGFATLCQDCGIAYQQLTFCEMFHSDETGWRECTSCGKRLHCGCIASSSLLNLLDTGGVNCNGCGNDISKLPSTPSEEKHKSHGPTTENGTNPHFEKMVTTQPNDDAENNNQQNLSPCKNIDMDSKKTENEFSGPGEIVYKPLSSFNQPSIELPTLVPTDLSISLSASPNPNAFQQGCRPRHLLPRLPNPILATGLQTNLSNVSQLRVARPPVEGRVKNQLLPRYWPRITDQELQQISGDSNSTIVPLFEKVLSASDAGRIGRLVLPKACAEAYFPPISQPEGLPLRMQDVKGKEWVFQFRFWPNNNSRMYVLEGVTPCIQSMNLQAGDTVTFSRMDPGGKLLMGFRKASNNTSAQKDSHYSMNSGAFQGEPFLGNAENLGGYSGFLHSLKGSRNTYLGNASKFGDNTNNLVSQSMLIPERKRRNIGPKSKRLLIDGHDSMELTLSWEEVQDMLRPPPSVEPSTVSVEDHEFEEFEEPPVLGKSSIFVVRLSGEQEQWAQCDNCYKWRKVPVDILLPPKWTCQDNINDHSRCSCSAPDELSPREIENLLKMNKDFTQMRFATNLKPTHEHESPPPVGIDHLSEQGASSVATTTKHPRHRPGCSCIVCIQPPSGKGKHKPTCTCNVCMTVKRRFKTLMMRKKKRQSEREAEIAQRNQIASAGTAADETETDHLKRSESEILLKCQLSDSQSQENPEVMKGGLDLNFRPGQENTGSSRTTMMSLLQEASLPLETYLRQNGLTSLVLPEQPVEDSRISAAAAIQEHEEGSNEFSEKH